MSTPIITIPNASSMSPEMLEIVRQMQAQMAAMQDALDRANKKLTMTLRVNMNGKGYVSVNGLARFAPSMSAAQWVTLFDNKDFLLEEIMRFKPESDRLIAEAKAAKGLEKK